MAAINQRQPTLTDLIIIITLLASIVLLAMSCSPVKPQTTLKFCNAQYVGHEMWGNDRMGMFLVDKVIWYIEEDSSMHHRIGYWYYITPKR